MLKYDTSNFYNDINYALMEVDTLIDNLDSIPESIIPLGLNLSKEVDYLINLQEKLAKIADQEKQQRKLQHQLEEWLADDVREAA